MPTSFQIPDLTKLCTSHDLELRANAHCRAVSAASLQTFIGLVKDEDEAERIRDMQLGLLAALCFPTCDMPQLRTATDLLMLLFWWWDRPEKVDGAAEEDAFSRYVPSL